MIAWSPQGERRCAVCQQLIAQPRIEAEVAIVLAARTFDAAPADMLTRRRSTKLVHARAFAVWMLRSFGRPQRSYPEIGRELGGREHSTIMNLHRMAIRLRMTEPGFGAACTGVAEHYAEMMESGHAC